MEIIDSKMKWSEHKNLSPEEKRAMRDAAAKVMGERLAYEGSIKAEAEQKESQEEQSTSGQSE